MWSRLSGSRWRHIAILIPMGLAIGLAVGLIFQDLVFGVLAGGGMGAAFGLLLAVRNPKQE